MDHALDRGPFCSSLGRHDQQKPQQFAVFESESALLVCLLVGWLWVDDWTGLGPSSSFAIQVLSPRHRRNGLETGLHVQHPDWGGEESLASHSLASKKRYIRERFLGLLKGMDVV
ncbi:MAG: hypothetical protein BYD32DRAFT_437374 [Podila humilis]|nr:MAG: hypothetical protein BYD32DRAFT_437374 [Podila humilis]